MGAIASRSIILTSRVYTEWPRIELKESNMKSTLHIQYMEPQVPNFLLFRSTFSTYRIILGFPIDSHVKISKCHKLLKCGRLPGKVITCTMIANALINLGLGHR